MDTTDKQKITRSVFYYKYKEFQETKESPVHCLFDEIVAPLQQENDRLRLALEKKESENKILRGVNKIAAERDYQETLSGKTGYDQVEVAMQRIRKAVEAVSQKEIWDSAQHHLCVDMAEVTHFEHGAEYVRKCVLSLLSSPVSGDAK